MATNDGGTSPEDWFKTLTSVWQGFIVPAVGGGWIALQVFWKRRDARRQSDRESQTGAADAANKERAQLSLDTQQRMRELREEVSAAEAENRTLRQALNNARTMVNAMEVRAGLPVSDWRSE